MSADGQQALEAALGEVGRSDVIAWPHEKARVSGDDAVGDLVPRGSQKAVQSSKAGCDASAAVSYPTPRHWMIAFAWV